jgi:hypothetical protein
MAVSPTSSEFTTVRIDPAHEIGDIFALADTGIALSARWMTLSDHPLGISSQAAATRPTRTLSLVVTGLAQPVDR